MPTPLAIFSCQPNSHPFGERHIALTEAAKVGRSVARSRPTTSNGIFDCKVLSRNHALLWYENNKFWLQDTRSSNGTFVNNSRLSSAQPEQDSPPREIFSGDIIQFGVEVVEKSKKGERVTHGCIIAQTTLFHPDGNEARRTDTIARMPAPSENLSAYGQEQIYQLAHYLKEALHREQMLEKKIRALKLLLENCEDASDSGWQALLNEDKLLAKLELLESQLEVYMKNSSDDSLKRQAVSALEERHALETSSKEMLTHMMEEKLVAVSKLDAVERHLAATQDECGHLRQRCEAVQEELVTLSAKYQSQVEEVEGLQERLSEAETEHLAELRRCENEKVALQTKLDDVVREAEALTAQVEALQADRDFSMEQLAAMKSHLSELRTQQERESSELVSVLPNGHLNLDPTPTQPSNGVAASPQDLSSSPSLEVKIADEHERLIAALAPNSSSSEERSSSSPERNAHPEDWKGLETAASGLLEQSESRLNESTRHVETLQRQLVRAHEDCVDHLQRISDLEDQLNLSETQINAMVDVTMADISTQLCECQRQTHHTCRLSRMLEREIEWLEQELARHSEGGEACGDKAEDGEGATLTTNSLTDLREAVEADGVKEAAPERSSTAMLARIRGLLCDVLANQKTTEATLRVYEGHLRSLRTSSCASTPDDGLSVSGGSTLGDPFDSPPISERDVADANLRENWAHSANVADCYKTEADELRVRLTEVESSLKLKEADLRCWQLEQHERTRAEFESLRLECVQLRHRIQSIEAAMRLSQTENVELARDYKALEESYRELEACKNRLEASTRANMTDAQKEADQSAEQMKEAKSLVESLKAKCSTQEAELAGLKNLLSNMGQEYRHLADRTRLLSAGAVIPLVILLFCTTVALFSAITA